MLALFCLLLRWNQLKFPAGRICGCRTCVNFCDCVVTHWNNVTMLHTSISSIIRSISIKHKTISTSKHSSNVFNVAMFTSSLFRLLVILCSMVRCFYSFTRSFVRSFVCFVVNIFLCPYTLIEYIFWPAFYLIFKEIHCGPHFISFNFIQLNWVAMFYTPFIWRCCCFVHAMEWKGVRHCLPNWNRNKIIAAVVAAASSEKQNDHFWNQTTKMRRWDKKNKQKHQREKEEEIII